MGDLGGAALEGGSILAGLVIVALAIVKACGRNGIYCRTPCGSSNYCVFDLARDRIHDQVVEGEATPESPKRR